MIKLKIKLDNGMKFEKVMTAEDIKQAENNKHFKKITRQNNNDFERYRTETYHNWWAKNNKKLLQRANDLQLYIGFLQTL